MTGKRSSKQVVIMGAGPTGLTAAHDLLKHGKDRYEVVVLEKDPQYVGGIARTVKYKDYRFDIGGHRFFSKNREIEDWWEEIMGDDFMTRPRLSRWYYRKKLFSYPIKPFEVLRVFGPIDSLRMVLGYLKVRLFPIKPEKNLADYYINQFGTFLAKPFFIDYNEKLWGIPCSELSMDFGKQRVKGLSFTSAIVNYFKKVLGLEKRGEVRTLIDKFRYPRYGPGMLWEKAKSLIEKMGGRVIMGAEVVKIEHKDFKIKSVVVRYSDGKTEEFTGDHLLSTIPLKDLVGIVDPAPPKRVLGAASALNFRDFIAVALIINRTNLFPDNWIYTHDEDMRSIRIQNFNNWSPYMNPNKKTTCLGFEYVCNRGDELWEKSDKEMVEQATSDLEKAGFAKRSEVRDGKVVHLTHVYPVYGLGYKEKVQTIKDYLDSFNQDIPYQLQPIGRGGIHRYNNMDHSMMTAILAVKNILGGNYDIWQVNVDAEYHEEKKGTE